MGKKHPAWDNFWWSQKIWRQLCPVINALVLFQGFLLWERLFVNVNPESTQNETQNPLRIRPKHPVWDNFAIVTLILETASSACIIRVALVGWPSHTNWKKMDMKYLCSLKLLHLCEDMAKYVLLDLYSENKNLNCNIAIWAIDQTCWFIYIKKLS